MDLSKCISTGCVITFYSEYSSHVAVTRYTLPYAGLQHATLEVYLLGLCNHALQWAVVSQLLRTLC